MSNSINEVFSLYERFGQADYIGEDISQIEHASQSAELAIAEGHDDEVILAAFFHDIGHICVMKDSHNDMDGFGIQSHEKIGATFLRSLGYPERIARLVENHVQAKRYLTYKYPSYYNGLSEASKRTLEYQGGRMTEEEANLFEADPLFALSIRMRIWDEKAKETGKPLLNFAMLKEKAIRVLDKSN